MIYTEVQYASRAENIPDQVQFDQWVAIAIGDVDNDIEVVIRVVDRRESAELNQQYRQKSGSTNVLSFPIKIPQGVNVDLIGDVVVCAPVIAEEADGQKKCSDDHWAHMVVHGVLHLLGYDHVEPAQTKQMEAKEISILQQLNIKNPYYKVL